MRRKSHGLLRLILAIPFACGAWGCTGGGGGGGNNNGNGNTNGNGNENGNAIGGGSDCTGISRCTSSGTEDDGIDFSGFGSTRILRSTIGEGRHVVAFDGQQLIFELDQPVPFCAVVPDNVTFMDLTTDQQIDLTVDQVQRQNITDANGDVVGAFVLIDVPSAVAVGRDYEVTLDACAFGLDGEFQQNPGTTQRSNGTLPSGDGNPGGDFVQLFRAVGFDTFLSDTRGAAGLALDAADNLFIVSENGLFGPFNSPKAVVEGDRLGQNLPSLASRPIVVDNDGDVIVKDKTSTGAIYEVDPDTGLFDQNVNADVTSFPDDAVIAPANYASVERSGIQPGDVVFSSTAQLSVLDRVVGGKKGLINLVDRAGSISDAYVSLFVPPAQNGAARSIYGVYKPEDDSGMQIHRILPNGTVDTSVLTNPGFLAGVSGTAAAQLQNIQGREEFLILGQIDSTVNLKRLLPQDFDGRGVFIYNETESRLSLLTTLPIDTFAFTFGPFSDVEVTSDLGTAFVSIGSANVVTRFTGLSNGGLVNGNPSCDPDFDDGLSLASGSARVYRSTLGNGRHLLKGAPTVLRFDIDQPVSLCQINADTITLADMATGQAIPLDSHRIKRQLIADSANNVSLGCRIIVDLPDTLTTGAYYELTLNGDLMGIDGDFQQGTGDSRTNGRLPSGDGTPGGAFVQIFQLVEGDYFLTETGGALGVDLDGSGALWASTATTILGPFSSPSTPGPATTITVGDQQEISGTDPENAGKPMVANDSNGGAAVTYAALRNFNLYDADPVTGINEIFHVGIGMVGLGSFQLDMVESPDGYPGDYIVTDELGGESFDIAGGISASLFASASQTVDYHSLYVPPGDRFGSTVYATVSDSFSGFLQVVQIQPDGTEVDLFGGPLNGATGNASARLQDYMNNAEYLIIGDFSRFDAQLATGQLVDSTTGSELFLYSPTTSTVQVLGSFSYGGDMTFRSDLDTVYTSNQNLRAVLRFQGLSNE